MELVQTSQENRPCDWTKQHEAQFGNSTTTKKEKKLRVKALRTALAADGESDESDDNSNVQTNEIDSFGDESEFPDHDDEASDTDHT
jgi:hypothetical protein